LSIVSPRFSATGMTLGERDRDLKVTNVIYAVMPDVFGPCWCELSSTSSDHEGWDEAPPEDRRRPECRGEALA
jgi:hypothetical protein